MHAASQPDPGIVLTGLLFGLMVLCAVIGGSVAHALRAPRVVGYLLGGAALKLTIGVLGPPEATLLSAPTVGPLNALVDLALCLILFSIGGVFETKHMRGVRGFVGRLAVAEAGITLVVVFCGVLGATLLTRSIIAEPVPLGTAIALAVLLACGAIATAPAATLFVLREYDAKGPVSDTMLSLVGINNIVCITLFQIAFVVMAATGMLGAGRTALSGLSIWEELAVNIGGSTVLGLLVAVLIAIVHARLRPLETFLVLIGVSLGVAGLEDWLVEIHGVSHNSLMTMIVAGAFFTNIAIDAEKLENVITTHARPIFIGFFAIAGFKLHLEDLANIGIIGAAYVLFRTVGKVAGLAIGVRWAKMTDDLRTSMGAGMLCQAAVVIGLAHFIHINWLDDWGSTRFVTVILGSVALFELLGPLLTKHVVASAGEVKAVTLLRRGDGSTSSVAAAIRITLGALFKPAGDRVLKPADDIRVRHVMRTNVKTLPAGSTFDEVLRFIERSRDSDFPVVDDHNQLVGLIRFHEIRKIIYNPHLRDLVTAADLVGAESFFVTPETPLDEVLVLFRSSLASALPVVESAEAPRVIGAVDQRDVLRAMHRSDED